jgi:putative SOS response-associated peptidase YedK
MPDKPKPLKQPFYITRRDGLPLTFARLWERWKDGMLSCTILTCEALDKTGEINAHRLSILCFCQATAATMATAFKIL